MQDVFWDRYHDIGSWWRMGIGTVVCVAIVVLVVWLLVRALGHRPTSGESAEELLRRRFAAGEIDDEEYSKRLEVLRRK